MPRKSDIQAAPSLDAICCALMRTQLLACVVLLSGCNRDECPNSKDGTSWCEGTRPVGCQGGGGDGFGYNLRIEQRDCAEIGQGCVENGEHASCGFPDRTCQPGTGSFCVDKLVTACGSSGHPVPVQDCADYLVGRSGFCVMGHDAAICSPSPDRCLADAGTRCISGVLASCTGGLWVPQDSCDSPALHDI